MWNSIINYTQHIGTRRSEYTKLGINCGGYWPTVLEQTLMVDRWELSVKWRFNGWSTVIKNLLYWQIILAMFASVIHELCFACSRITLILHPTVGQDGARLRNTCILPSFPRMVPTQLLGLPTTQSPFSSHIPLAPGVYKNDSWAGKA